jgi:hypothetical protein
MRLGRDLRVEDYLRPPFSIPKVDEDEPAVVAVAVDPSLQNGALPRVGSAKVATAVRSAHVSSTGVSGWISRGAGQDYTDAAVSFQLLAIRGRGRVPSADG